MAFSFLPSIPLKDSLLARLGLAMGTIALLSFISMALSTAIADNSLGKANAINSAGSLRMMSYRLLSYAATDAPPEKIAASVNEFQSKLDVLEQFVVARSADYSELPRQFAQIQVTWRDGIAPTLLGLNGASIGSTTRAHTLTALELAIPDFVAQINGAVFLLEEDLEHKIALLRSLQIALLVMTVVLCLVTIWLMQHQVVRPLKDLLHAASRVRDKDFSAKARHTDADELGQLGAAFNTMVAEIAATYDNQQRLISERTRELTDSNRSLELMYQSALQLSDSNLTPATLKRLLDDIEAKLDIGEGTLCLSEHRVFPAHRLHTNLVGNDLEKLCGERGCADCFRKSEARATGGEATHDMVFVPINDAGSISGVMPFKIKAGQLPEWKARVLDAIGRNLAMALSKMQRQEERHRIAVLEERSVIARELHDSIAQSLSYLRIQVARLEKQPMTPADQGEIVSELKKGLASAYKELRELISAFRLKVDERGFQMALTETADEFRQRCQLSIHCHNELPPTLLSANEEIHVLRIIREALANIEKHARASVVTINAIVTHDGQAHIRIADNGIGIGEATSPDNHYGLIIMADRAQSLAGKLRVRERPEGGTEVLLTFTPEKSVAADVDDVDSVASRQPAPSQESPL